MLTYLQNSGFFYWLLQNFYVSASGILAYTEHQSLTTTEDSQVSPMVSVDTIMNREFKLWLQSRHQ